MDIQRSLRQGRTGAVWLTALAGLFGLRVAAQLTQRLAHVSALPRFETWQSGAVPYQGLLVSQLLILIAMGVVLNKAWNRRLSLGPTTAKIMNTVGGIYFVFMVGRLVAGLTFWSGHPWWDAPLPSVFHMVLATFGIATAQLSTEHHPSEHSSSQRSSSGHCPSERSGEPQTNARSRPTSQILTTSFATFRRGGSHESDR